MGYANVDQGKGQGIRYKNSGSLIYEAAMMMGSNPNNLSNAARNAASSADNHFSRRTAPLPLPSVSGMAPLDFRGSFSDANNAQQYGLLSRYDILGFGGAADTNYFVQVLTIRNTSARDYPNFYTGYYSDPDISPNGQADRCNFDSARNMGYVFQNEQGGLYMGISVVSGVAPSFYAIENDATAPDSIGVYDGFTIAEKYKSLTSGTRVKSAGYNATPGKDVSMSIGAGPYNLPAGDSIKVAFAFMVGKDLESLQLAADQARQNTVDLVVSNKKAIKGASAVSLAPNPGKDHISIQSADGIVSVALLDPAGKTVLSLSPESAQNRVQTQVTSLKPGLYIALIKTGSGMVTRKFVKD